MSLGIIENKTRHSGAKLQSIVMLSVIMLSVVMPSVVMLNVVMLSVVAPFETDTHTLAYSAEV